MIKPTYSYDVKAKEYLMQVRLREGRNAEIVLSRWELFKLLLGFGMRVNATDIVTEKA